MPLTPEQFLNLDLGFPGMSFGFESWALESYLNVLEEQIDHARDQYRLRAQRELKARDLKDFEYVHMAAEIDEVANTQIPRFFRIGAVVSIWGLFESFASDLAAYAGRREKAGLSFKDIRADSLRVQVEKYFEKVLRISLPWSPRERELLGQLQELRHFLAHRNGRLMDLSSQSEEKVRSLVSGINGVAIESSTVVVSSKYLTEAANLVFTTAGALSQLLSDRYGGPVVLAEPYPSLQRTQPPIRVACRCPQPLDIRTYDFSFHHLEGKSSLSSFGTRCQHPCVLVRRCATHSCSTTVRSDGTGTDSPRRERGLRNVIWRQSHVFAFRPRFGGRAVGSRIQSR